MSKLRLVAVILAVVAIVAGGMSVAAAKQQERKDGQAARAEYTVAAASTSAEAGVAVGTRVVVPIRRGALGPLSETLTLVMVGGLLLGLAAAVRRTT